MYLTHFIVQLQSIGEIRQPKFGNFWTLVSLNVVSVNSQHRLIYDFFSLKKYWEINADLMTALSYSVLFNLIVEAPCRKIFKELISKSRKGKILYFAILHINYFFYY